MSEWIRGSDLLLQPWNLKDFQILECVRQEILHPHNLLRKPLEPWDLVNKVVRDGLYSPDLRPILNYGIIKWIREKYASLYSRQLLTWEEFALSLKKAVYPICDVETLLEELLAALYEREEVNMLTIGDCLHIPSINTCQLSGGQMNSMSPNLSTKKQAMWAQIEANAAEIYRDNKDQVGFSRINTTEMAMKISERMKERALDCPNVSTIKKHLQGKFPFKRGRPKGT